MAVCEHCIQIAFEQKQQQFAEIFLHPIVSHGVDSPMLAMRLNSSLSSKLWQTVKYSIEPCCFSMAGSNAFKMLSSLILAPLWSGVSFLIQSDKSTAQFAYGTN